LVRLFGPSSTLRLLWSITDITRAGAFVASAVRVDAGVFCEAAGYIAFATAIPAFARELVIGIVRMIEIIDGHRHATALTNRIIRATIHPAITMKSRSQPRFD
jgi:hypothetical protein